MVLKNSIEGYMQKKTKKKQPQFSLNYDFAEAHITE
jgi:hypothetical protein